MAIRPARPIRPVDETVDTPARPPAKPKIWLVKVYLRGTPDIKTAHLFRKLGLRPSKHLKDCYVSAYAFDCRPLLDFHVQRLKAIGLKPKIKKAGNWLNPEDDTATLIDRALARHAKRVRQGHPMPLSIKEPRREMSPARFARQWLTARAQRDLFAEAAF